MAKNEMAAARSRRILGVLDLVLELDPALRGAYLETIGRGDPELKLQVLAILRTLSGEDAAEGTTTQEVARLTSLELPERVGPYQIKHEIGRGGMSRVYLAERADQEFERQVALKVIDQGLEAPIVHQRFLAERQILASFDHPAIAKLIDGGSLPNGRPYLVMELVDGLRVDAYCVEKRLDLRGRLRLFRSICGAVSYAHQQLVVHRDLKPSNILVKDGDEVKLLDFGIAKLLDPESFPFTLAESTRSHLRPMTPTHASPEQLLGEPISTATDIYALGVLLYQLLTGAVPHAEPDRLQQVLRERSGQASLPKPSQALAGPDAEHTWQGQDRRHLARQVSGDLDNIVAKALRPLPAERYASVTELDEDLRRYLDGEPVRATRETPLYLFGKFLRRYRLPVALTALLLLAISSFAAITRSQATRIEAERDRANEIRVFLSSLISSADSQQRRAGSVSLNDLLEENLQRLQDRPFQDARTQFELFELLGDSFYALDLDHRACAAYQLALRQGRLEKATWLRCVLKETRVCESAGLAHSPDELLEEAVPLAAGDLDASIEILARLQDTTASAGEHRQSAKYLALAFEEFAKSEKISAAKLLDFSIYRLTLLLAASNDRPLIESALADSVTLLQATPRTDDHPIYWMLMARTLEFLDRGSEASLTASRLAYSLHGATHRHAVTKTMLFEQMAETLQGQRRLAEALRANAVSLGAAQGLFELGPENPRAQFQLALAKTRRGSILLDLGRREEANEYLAGAISLLENRLPTDATVFPRNTLTRAYLLAGRQQEAAKLLQYLLDKGWRRADLMRAAAAAGALPHGVPPDLAIDFRLPRQVRSFLGALPHPPPPWQAPENLPTIEEILAAEEALSAGTAAAS